MERLTGKLIVTATITLQTGLHIGGSKTSIEVGEIDSNVIKTKSGIPYIPGSSLKGKIRSLLERNSVLDKVNNAGICIDSNHPIGLIFGVGATDNSKPTRIIFRDSFMCTKQLKETKDILAHELLYTESKHENLINRNSGGTQRGGLRELERVTEGTTFDLEFVYNLSNSKDVKNFELVFKGLRLLEDDYLGGSGSRGYGKIKFSNIKIVLKTDDFYIGKVKEPILILDEETLYFETNLVDKILTNGHL